MKTIWKLLACFMLCVVVCGCDFCGDEEYVKWDNGEIRYYLDSSCSDYEKRQFREIAQEWNDLTNIKFIESENSGNYICIIKKADKSAVSDICGKHKNCWIKYKTFNDRCNILHEQAHLILGHHTHQLPNRDKYIYIVWPNITEEERDQYQRLNYYDFPFDYKKFEYDYNSILHYEGHEFAKNSKIPTIVSQTSKKINIFGISEIDIEKVNNIYQNKN